MDLIAALDIIDDLTAAAWCAISRHSAQEKSKEHPYKFNLVYTKQNDYKLTILCLCSYFFLNKSLNCGNNSFSHASMYEFSTGKRLRVIL